jgi:hypothetical protein
MDVETCRICFALGSFDSCGRLPVGSRCWTCRHSEKDPLSELGGSVVKPGAAMAQLVRFEFDFLRGLLVAAQSNRGSVVHSHVRKKQNKNS